MARFLLLTLFTFSTIALVNGQTLAVDLVVDHITIEGQEVKFSQSPTASAKVRKDHTTTILPLASFDEEQFGVRFVYHHSFNNVSAPGANPEWQKTHNLVIEFYRKDSDTHEWNWLATAPHRIEESIKTKSFIPNSFTVDYEPTKKQYRFNYSYRVN